MPGLRLQQSMGYDPGDGSENIGAPPAQRLALACCTNLRKQ